MAFVVAPATASACSCIAAHPATKLAQSDRALVGVVESRAPIAAPSGISAGWEYVVRVERTLKGAAADRVTLRSGMTSCQLTLEVGQRVGLTHVGADQEIHSCSYVDPDELLAASALPAPSGTPELTAVVEGAPGTDTVLLGARGQVAGYGFPRGEVLAQGRCTSGGGVTEAVRDADGKILVGSTEVPVRDVLAVGCTENGRRQWAIGRSGADTVLLTVRNGQVEERMRRRADAATIAGSRAYFVHGGDLVRIVPLTGGKLRAARIEGKFASIAGNGDRVAGHLRDGRSAVLNVRTGKLVTGPKEGRLTWLDDNRLLGSGAVYDARLRKLRDVTTRGTLVGAVAGAAFFADGEVLYRLAPGARRAVRFAELPGRVTSVDAAPTSRALKSAWHSCDESAKTPLTT
ncbi:hypothetical protein OJ998_27205 [Solirubrobacter taibaiensis]|nr:hypothetical protein [Solirubrobacter taibaiensis]